MHSDTLSITWNLISACNYGCSYCRQEHDLKNCVLVRDRLLLSAYRLLSMPHASYHFILTGGEPTLHPLLPDLTRYLFSTGYDIAVTLETNGSAPLALYRSLADAAAPQRLEVLLSVHLEHADPQHVLEVVATVAEAGQLAHVRLMHHPDRHQEAQRFFSALCGLRRVLPFALDIAPVLTTDGQEYPCPEDRRQWRATAQRQFDARAAQAAPLPMRPLARPAATGPTSAPVVVSEERFCCLGVQNVHIDCNGSCHTSSCAYGLNRGFLWDMDEEARNALPHIVRCDEEACPLRNLPPSAEDAETAEAELQRRRDLALQRSCDAPSLINPVTGEPDMRALVRAHFQELRPLRETVERIDPVTTAVVTFGDVLEEAVRHYRQQDPPLPFLPPFVLADWDGSPHPAREETAARLQVSIVPLAARGTLEQRRFCLYARPDRRFWEQGCIQPLLRLCAAAGLTSVQLDAAVARPMQARPPRPHIVRQRFADIVRIYAALADEESREVFLRAMKALESGDPGYLPISAYPQYAHPLVHAEPGDSIIEGGLNDGETTKTFAEIAGEQGRVFAFEPRRAACDAIRERIGAHPRITLEQLGLWSCASTFYIEDQGGGSRMVTQPNERTEECRSIDIDGYLRDRLERCSLIKLDIEGAEMACLEGAAGVIARDYPRLQISLYHHPDHYLDIPLRLLRHHPDYTLYIGHHGWWYYATCLYALPPQDKAWKPAQALLRPAAEKEPAVSVVIPAHNNEDTLRRCVDSVLIQGVPDVEIILVDDASSDSTPDIIAEYARRYPHIVRSLRFYENKGAGPARNAGMDRACGRYLTFIDSDDMLAEGFLQRGLALMETEQADIVCFDMLVHDKNHQEERWGITEGMWSGKDSLRQLLLQNIGGYATYARLYRADHLRHHAVRYSDTRVHEDMFFSVQAFYFSRKTLAIADIGYCRYLRPGSLSSHTHREAYFTSFTRFASFLTNFYRQNGLSLEDEGYRYCLQRLYNWDRRRLFDTLGEADKQGKTDELLSEKNLAAFASSREILRCILTDYARLYCWREGLTPRVAAEDRDWRKAATELLPPRDFTAWGNSLHPTGAAPLLSVIVPNYNKAPWLAACLNSILRQDMADFEVLVIDDASTDGSYTLLQHYARSDRRIRLFRMAHNCLQGVCRNIGIDLARGRYLTFVDSDDRVETGFFARACRDMDTNPTNILIYGIRDIDIDNNELGYRNCRPLYSRGREALYSYNKSMMPYGPVAKLFCTNFLKKKSIYFPAGIYHEDVIFMMNALLQSDSVRTRPENFVYIVVHTSNSSIRPHSYSYRYIRSSCEKIKKRQLFSETHPYIQYSIQNRLLPPLQAYLADTGDIALTEQDWTDLESNPAFIKALLIGYARCRARGPIPAGILPELPQRRKQAFLPEATEQPLVTVIVPVYNQEKYIERCLRSILGQSLRRLEIIVIDDASTDSTRRVCEALAAQDARVRVYSNERNSGQGYSRNRAQELARGTYITYVDSDDYIKPDFFLRGVSILEQFKDIDVVHFNYRRHDVAGRMIYDAYMPPRCYQGNELLEAYCKGELKSWAVWSKIYRREFLHHYGITSPHCFYEDNFFLLQVYMFSRNFLIEEGDYYVNICTPHQASTMLPFMQTKKHIEGFLHTTALMESFLKKYHYEELSLLRLSHMFHLFRKACSWLTSLQDTSISPLTDTMMEDLQQAPHLLRLLLEDYARLYIDDISIKQQSPNEDRDVLTKDIVRSETFLIPYENSASTISPCVISVIIPAYNTEMSISSCLDSILAQDIENIEILLIDDCSTDCTFTICQSYAQKHNNIRLFRTSQSSGPSVARNLALSHATGKYITFVDSDDWLEPGFFQQALQHMEQDISIDMLVCTYRAWDLLSGKELYRKQMPAGLVLTGREAVQAYLMEKIPTYACWSILFKRELLEHGHCQFNPTKANGDELFLLSAYGHATKVKSIDLLAYTYVTKSENPSIMRPHYRGKDFFMAVVDNISAFFAMIQSVALDSNVDIHFLESIGMERFARKPHHLKNLLQYIKACAVVGKPTPLTDDVLKKLSCSRAYLRYLVTDYARRLQQEADAKHEKEK